MSPYEEIESAYARNPKEEPFDNYARWYAKHGFSFATPHFFVIGRPVIRGADPEHIKDPTHLFVHQDCDAWFIHAAAGNMARMWSIMPWELPFIGWTRLADPLSELRFFPTESLKRLCPPDISRCAR